MLRLVVLAASMLGTVAVAAPPTRDTGERAADTRDKVICKRFIETGSLVKGTRICKTKAEWDRARDEAQQSNAGQSTACQPGLNASC